MIRAATDKDFEVFENNASYAPSRRAKGIVSEVEGEIGAMVVYDHWTFTTVQTHVYAPKFKYFLEPLFLEAIFRYPFVTCDKQRLMAVTPEESKGSLAVSRYLGFEEVYRIKDGWMKGSDMVIKELMRKNCRWLQKKAA